MDLYAASAGAEHSQNRGSAWGQPQRCMSGSTELVAAHRQAPAEKGCKLKAFEPLVSTRMTDTVKSQRTARRIFEVLTPAEN
jgi:hypothetical protein